MTAEVDTTSDVSRIVRFEASNIMGLRAVHITPKGNVVKITGPNGAGKTTVLKSIWMALGGKRAIPDDAIRTGENEAFVELELTSHTVRLNLKRGDDGTIIDSLTLKDKDGARIGRPMEVLTSMVGMTNFDPLAFIRANASDQAKMLLDALGVDYSSLDDEYKAAFEERTSVNRDIKNLGATYRSMTHHQDAPSAEINVAELTGDLETALQAVADNNEYRDAYQHRKEELAHAQSHVGQLESQLQALQNEIESERGRIEKITADITQMGATIETLKDPEVATIRQRIKTVDAQNQMVRENAAREQTHMKLREAEKQADALTKQLDEIKAKKRAMLVESKFPLEGVEIDDDGSLLYRGHPLANCGGEEQMRIAVAMVLAAKSDLHVITLDEGLGVIDDDQLAALEALAREHGFDIWMTGPRAVGENCIQIRDGAVA